jgi:hypothetical protein
VVRVLVRDEHGVERIEVDAAGEEPLHGVAAAVDEDGGGAPVGPLALHGEHGDGAVGVRDGGAGAEEEQLHGGGWRGDYWKRVSSPSLPGPAAVESLRR